MSEQKPEIVVRSDLKKYEKNLLNSAVSRSLQENGEDVGDLSNRGRAIAEILKQGRKSVDLALAVEFMKGDKESEEKVNTIGYVKSDGHSKRPKNARQRKLLHGSSFPVIQTVITHNFL